MWGGTVARVPYLLKQVARSKHALTGRDTEHSFADIKKLLSKKKKRWSCLHENGKVFAVGEDCKFNEDWTSKTIQRNGSEVAHANRNLHSSNGVVESKPYIAERSTQIKTQNPISNLRDARCQPLDKRLERLDSYAHVIAKEIVPDFNSRKSSRTVLAFGRHNASLKVSLSGQYAGFWYDFDPGMGGRMVSLIKYFEECTWRQALEIGEKIIACTNEPPLDLSLRGEPGDSIEERWSRSSQAVDYSNASVPLVNTLGEEYLRLHRKITLQPGEDVRFLRKDRFLDSYDSILIQARNHTGQITAVQKTFLLYPSAEKARVEKPKLTYGDMEGGSFVRVNDPFEPQEGIAVFAEGLETALTVAQALRNKIPCYATLGLWNFSKIPLFLSRGSHPIICADHDSIENAKPRDNRVRAAFHASGWNRQSYSIIRPDPGILPKGGSDYNDVIRKFPNEDAKVGLAEVRNDLVRKIPGLKPMAY